MSPKIMTACAALLLALPIVACDEGPAEQAGERVDRAIENMRDSVDPPRGPAERMGREVDRATQ